MDRQSMIEQAVMNRAVKAVQARSVATFEVDQEPSNYRRDDALMARALYLVSTDFGTSRELQQAMAEVLARRFPEYDRAYRETGQLNDALGHGMPIKAGGPTREDVTAFLDQRRAVKDAKDQPVQKARIFDLGDENLPF